MTTEILYLVVHPNGDCDRDNSGAPFLYEHAVAVENAATDDLIVAVEWDAEADVDQPLTDVAGRVWFRRFDPTEQKFS